MVSILARSSLRELGRRRRQYAAIAVTIALGVALFGATRDAYLNLESSYERTYDRLAFADLTITGGDSTKIADTVATISGVEAVTVRRQADVPIRIGDHELYGRVVGTPDGTDRGVGRLDIVDGAPPESPDAVIAERHMADHFDIEPDDGLEIRLAEGWERFEVAGSAVSAEYIWPARSRQDVLTSPDDFGVVFASPSVLDRVAGTVTQVLVRFDPDSTAPDPTRPLTEMAMRLGADGVQERADQPSNAALREDVAGFGEMSVLFPALFGGAAAMAIFVVLSRVVRERRTEVAVLVANGMPRRRIIGLFAGQALALTAAAGVVGVAAGAGLGRVVTGLYTDAISVPDTVIGFHPLTVVTGLGFALVTGVVAAAGPVVAATRVPPGEALRGRRPTGSGGRSLVERIFPTVSRLPVRWRMALRGISRNPRRSISTVVGVVAALTLILASWGLVDTVDVLVHRQFDEVQLEDARLYVDDGLDDAVATVASVPGVARAEGSGEAAMTVAAGDQTYATRLVTFESDTTMHGFGGTGLPADGVVAGRSLGDLLDVDVGDEVRLTSTATGDAADVTIAGFVDEPLGTLVYARTSAIPEIADGLTPTVLVRYTDDVARDLMRTRLTDLDAVTAFVDSRSLLRSVQDLLGLFYVFVGTMVAFAAVMAFAMLFNTAAVNVAERSSELSVMRIDGVAPRTIGRLLAAENLMLTAVACGPGIVVGRLVAGRLAGSFSSDLFDFGLEMRPLTPVVAAGAVLVVSLLSQWPVTRAVLRVDPAQVIRTQGS